MKFKITMFYEGLRPELEDNTSFILEKTHKTLMLDTWNKNQEMIQRKKPRKTERTQAVSTAEEIEEMKAMIQNLNKDE